MTTYYVKPTGDNGLDGLSEANAWQTITYALTQMIAYDTLNIMAGTYPESVSISTEHITLTGAGSGLVTANNLHMTASYFTGSGMTLIAHPSISDDTFASHCTLNDIVAEERSVLAYANNIAVTNCDFMELLLPFQADAASFTDVIVRCRVNYGLYVSAHVGANLTFDNITILGVAGTYGGVYIGAATSKVFTNITFEYPENAIQVASSASATFIQNDRKVFVGTVGTNTVDADKSTLVVADGTYDYRDFIITPNASIVISETSLWETTGDQNKTWKVEATGSRTITFQLGDMLPNNRYDLFADGAKVASAMANSAGVLSFDYTGTFSTKTFTTALGTEDVSTDYLLESWTVSKGVQDALWVINMKIDKHVVPAFFEMIQATATDHNGNPHTPFVGIIPSVDLTLASAANKATLTGYDYAWYLTVQYVPTDDRITLEDTNPSKTIEALLGGGSWATVTGIEPHRINNVDDWDNIKKSFEFGDRCTRWKAIQEICDYCNFVFVVKWRDVAGTWQPSAYFVHEDDIDTNTPVPIGLDIPAAITITEPDSHLIDGVSIKDSPEHQYNRVLVTGYDMATDTYFYATAQTAAVGAGTDIAIEYVYADASLNTDQKTSDKAQELLDFFQASAKVYVARFKQRMDLELYQKINFVGYNKIEAEEMRITRITYTRAAYNDIVEIEFMKDQAVQQLKRLARAVNPDYVSGQQDMMNSDLSDVGLIDVFDDPIAGGTASDDMWEIPEGSALTQLVSDGPISLQGWSLDNASGVRGSPAAEFSIWGGDDDGVGITELLRWHNYETGLPKNPDSGADMHKYLEITETLLINNDNHFGLFPKIYFGFDPFKPVYIRGNTWDGNDHSIDFYVDRESGADARRCSIGAEGMYVSTKLDVAGSLIAWHRIEGWGNNNLVFWDNATGQVTLKQLSEGGECGGLTNPLTEHLDMGNYAIENCGAIDCDAISCTGIALDGFSSRINFNTGYISNLQNIAMEGYASYIKDVAYIDFWARSAADPPGSPSGGTLWYDGNNALFKYWTGSAWKTITAT